MLLNDIGKSPDATFRRINQHLETNFGFKIAENVSDKDLLIIMEQMEEEITNLKIIGNDSKSSSEISKRLLILEGIKNLREYAYMQFQSPDLEKVIRGMVDFVVNDFKLCGTHQGSFEESINDAMKQYRSSKYRFPDNMIEDRVRQEAMDRLQNDPSLGEDTDSFTMSSSMFEDTDEDESQLDGEFTTGIAEGDPWASIGKRAQASGGHSIVDLDTPKARHALNVLDNPDLDKAGFVDYKDEQVPMCKDKNGKMVVDPFAAQAAARRKGIVMKEHANLVKSLRRLLETEVSQAEVMMAAKGFAQELQEMVEKIGRLQNEDLPPVTDQMRETYGMESASAFQTQIYGALQSVMDSLYTAKSQVDDAVGSMASTGQVGAETDMDMPIDGADTDDMSAMDADVGDEADLDNIAADLEKPNDEFGGAEEEEPLGRSKKMESARHLQRKVLEMKKLVEKAKKLKETVKR